MICVLCFSFSWELYGRRTYEGVIWKVLQRNSLLRSGKKSGWQWDAAVNGILLSYGWQQFTMTLRCNEVFTLFWPFWLKPVWFEAVVVHARGLLDAFFLGVRIC